MFEELNTPLPDQSLFLKRMGLSDVKKADLETLSRLIRAHQLTVPFENLSVYDAESEILLDTVSLFDKIVVQRRGGYCFELNALFMSLLKSVGYDCYPVLVRVVWMIETYMPVTHRATIVTIDGVRYFVDVGFGGPSPSTAVRLDDTNPQTSGANDFVFDKAPDGDFIIYRLTEKGREQLLKFSDRRCENVDFLAPNEYQSKNKNAGFKKVRMINISLENGSAAITGNILRIHKDSAVEETVLDTEEKLRQALREHFGIVVDFPLKME
ncbi:MAG: arylamine N-acetyltransferase [Clostridiales bacterium]|nr:arylamine N-acetyltransferase [Clostridiales bacterium]